MEHEMKTTMYRGYIKVLLIVLQKHHIAEMGGCRGSALVVKFDDYLDAARRCTGRAKPRLKKRLFPPYELWSKLLKGGLYGGFYRGMV